MTQTVASNFPLELTPDLRQAAEEYASREGVTLNDFINLAVVEKVNYLKHEEWVRSRKKPTKELAMGALVLLEKNRGQPVVPGDELPEGYTPS